MQYTALLTRSYPGLDESIQIILDDVDNLAVFKQRVFDALKITDYRGNKHMRTLFEDTELTNSLDYHELQSAKHTTDLLYPLEALPSKLELGSPKGSIEFSKLLAQGEVLKLFLHEVDTYEDLASAIKGIWEIIDKRLEKTNKRELDTRDYLKKIDISTRLKIMNIIDILYGTQFKDTVIEKLKAVKLEEEVAKVREDIINSTNSTPTLTLDKN